MSQTTIRSSLRSPRIEVDQIRDLTNLPVLPMVIFWLLHIPLAFVLQASRLLSTVHALVTLGLAVIWLIVDRQPYKLITVTAYIVASEMLWRITGAYIFWEIGKYALIVLLTISLLAHHDLAKISVLPLFYFLFLAPAIFQVVGETMPSTAASAGLLDLPGYYLGFDREALAFQLAGPFALTVATIYFGVVRLNRLQTAHVLSALLAPIFGILALAAYSTVTAGPIVFGSVGALDRVTSAGVSPNQISSVFGLGTVAAFLLIFLFEKHKLFQVLLGTIAVGLLVQALLTFSRGGVWTALGAILVCAIYLLRNPRSRNILIPLAVLLFVVVTFVLLPRLQDFTGGTAIGRFTDTYTVREEIIAANIRAFRENPIFGVGPGHSSDPRYLNDPYHPDPLHSHTEYTRALAEHGLLGVLSLVVLAIISLGRFFRKQPPLGKAIAVSMTVWALLYMGHSATRLVAPSFVFGLGAATFLLGDEPVEADDE